MSSVARQSLILVADDDPMVRLLTTETLAGAGFRAVAAADGEEALAAFAAEKPNAVILDVNMPKLDGLGVCRKLRKELHTNIPVLFVTGQDDIEAIHDAFEAGATDFVSKPLNWAVLPYRLQYMLRASRLRDELARSQQRTAAVLDAIPDQILLLDEGADVLDQVNRPIDLETGEWFEESRTPLDEFFPGDVAQRIREQARGALDSQRPASFECKVDDAGTACEIRLLPQPDGITMAIVRDITERQRSEARIRQLAYFDAVTGLPNRQSFIGELERAMRNADRERKLAAVLYIDLDRFKRINDTFGHTVGDSLLKAVGERMAGCVRPLDFVATSALGGDTFSGSQVARLGGDEFVVLLTNLDTPDEAGIVAKRIRQTLKAPFNYDGREFVVTPSIGIAVYPDDARDVETLLMRADMAMYNAKSVRNTVRFYVGAMDAEALDRLRLESEIRDALQQERFSLHYQPKHSLQTGEVVGAEALLRWNHAERGWVAPATFIEVAEETGLIEPLGNWVIDEACRQLKLWQRRGLDLRIAINVSAEQVARTDVARNVLETVWKRGVRPQSLELEFTESVLMQDVETAEAMMRQLKDAGVRLSIDDFGTGYSSLSYVRQFPLDTLKIDRSFVQNLHQDADDAAICRAIVAMGMQLGLTIVAEGVELEEQRDFLAHAGCHEAQGFLFSRPMPAEAFEAFVREEATIASLPY